MGAEEVVSTLTLLPFVLVPLGARSTASLAKDGDKAVLIGEEAEVEAKETTNYFKSSRSFAKTVKHPTSRDFAGILRWNINFASSASLRPRVEEALSRLDAAHEISKGQYNENTVNRLAATALLHALAKRAYSRPQIQSAQSDAVEALILVCTANTSAIPWQCIRRKTMHMISRALAPHVFEGNGRLSIPPEKWPSLMPFLLYDKAIQMAQSRSELTTLYTAYRILAYNTKSATSSHRISRKHVSDRVKDIMRTSFKPRRLQTVSLAEYNDFQKALHTLTQFVLENADTPLASPFLVSLLAREPGGMQRRTLTLEPLFSRARLEQMLASREKPVQMLNALLSYAHHALGSADAVARVLNTALHLNIMVDQTTLRMILRSAISTGNQGQCHSVLSVLGLPFPPGPTVTKLPQIDETIIQVDAQTLELYLRAATRFGDHARAAFVIRRLLPDRRKHFAWLKYTQKRHKTLPSGLLMVLLSFAFRTQDFRLFRRIWAAATESRRTTLRKLANSKHFRLIKRRPLQNHNKIIIPLDAYHLVGRLCAKREQHATTLKNRGILNNHKLEARALLEDALRQLKARTRIRTLESEKMRQALESILARTRTI